MQLCRRRRSVPWSRNIRMSLSCFLLTTCSSAGLKRIRALPEDQTPECLGLSSEEIPKRELEKAPLFQTVSIFRQVTGKLSASPWAAKPWALHQERKIDPESSVRHNRENILNHFMTQGLFLKCGYWLLGKFESFRVYIDCALLHPNLST